MKLEPEELAELAHLYASEGLEGERLQAFEAWRSAASDEELAQFAAMLDTCAILAEAHAPVADLPPELEQRVLGSILPTAEEPTLEEDHFYLRSDEGDWVSLPVPGVRLKELSARDEDGVTVFLLEMEANTRLPAHSHHGVEMAFMLEGDLRIGDVVLTAGDFTRAPAGSDHHQLSSRGGCRALLITASENFPRHTVGAMQKFQDTMRALKDVLGGGPKG
ncbi:anti-ecf sigma factor, chrr [Haloferula helveola]|uniref:Anti-ecf sigma factor, chrr n=1 Tax=Haloferula helveola TaxID=490095 RepID=A0ABN6HFA8_9BACT|nr:anti-ecf sigma factor, chrr [Haloferula helveola]